MSESPLIWVLLGARTGDNNQALALAEALDLPFETRELDYNWLQALSVWLPPTALTLKRQSKKALQPPWPDLVIAIGRRSVPVARWIKKKSGGRSKLVRIGNPRIDPKIFDLVVTTRQYPVPPGENVTLLPVAMSRFLDPPEADSSEKHFIDKVAPYRLVAIGGPTKYWEMPNDRLARIIANSIDHEQGLVVATSRRTPKDLVSRISKLLEGHENAKLVDGPSPRFAVLMENAEEIFVTGDSVSMLSEAVLAGKPVALIPIERDAKGLKKLGEEPRERGKDAKRRDLRRFWDYLIAEGLVGSDDDGPKAATNVPNPNAIAAEAVKKIL